MHVHVIVCYYVSMEIHFISMTSCINLVPFKGAEMYLGKQQFQVNDFMLLLLSSRSKHNFQHQTSNKGEVKHKQLVCVCKDTDSWNIRFSATLLSLATLSSSAFIKKNKLLLSQSGEC